MNSQCLEYKGKENSCSTVQTQRNGYKCITDSVIDKIHQEFKDNVRFRNTNCQNYKVIIVFPIAYMKMSTKSFFVWVAILYTNPSLIRNRASADTK